MREYRGCVRLCVFLSILWLAGMAFWGVAGWYNWQSFRSPFVYAVSVDPTEKIWRINDPLEFWRYTSPQPRFRWGWFLAVTGGGLLGIWLLPLGTVWVIRGFRQKTEPPQRDATHRSNRSRNDEHRIVHQ